MMRVPSPFAVRFHDPTAEPVLTPADRFRAACDLHDLAVEMIAARVRRDRPDATQAHVDDAVRAWLQGGDLGPGRLRT